MVKLWCAVSALAILFTAIPTVFAQPQGQWTTTGAMQSTRELGAQVLLASGNVLTFGGVDNSNNVLAAAEVYNASQGTWKATGSMIQARQLFAAVVLKSGKVLVVGGLGTSNIVLQGVELYDPTTGAWTGVAALPVPRFGHTATLLPSGKVLVTGGCTSNTACADTPVSELYDPTTNSWSVTGSLNTSRHYHTAVLLQTGKVLAVGGYNGSATTTSCEIYDPSTGAWTTAASTNTARYRNTTTLLSDGKVLAAGGASGRFPITSAEIYDPSANKWTTTGNMTIRRYSHTATLLPDGTVVVAGGVGQSTSCGKACVGYIPTAKVDIYNEATGTFTATGSLSRSRAYQATTLLATGVALTAGGMSTTNICCVVVNSAEFYTPLSLTFSATSLNFGFLQVGLSSAAQTVTVNNVSNHSVTFASIAASGDFSQSNSCPATLPMSQSCTISITFTPTVAGARSGAVTLKDNSPGSPQQTIALSGTGGAGALTFTVSSLNLGSVIPGYSSYQNATLINDSAGAVNITGISIAPANGTFTSTNNCPTTLNPQQSCVFQVVFSPPDTGNYSATLTVTNSGNGAPATLALSGIGLD
jgi:N-acetylneuraminic acid mutarotase